MTAPAAKSLRVVSYEPSAAEAHLDPSSVQLATDAHDDADVNTSKGHSRRGYTAFFTEVFAGVGGLSAATLRHGVPTVPRRTSNTVGSTC